MRLKKEYIVIIHILLGRQPGRDSRQRPPGKDPGPLYSQAFRWVAFRE
jgi:hypothetical protein